MSAHALGTAFLVVLAIGMAVGFLASAFLGKRVRFDRWRLRLIDMPEPRGYDERDVIRAFDDYHKGFNVGLGRFGNYRAAQVYARSYALAKLRGEPTPLPLSSQHNEPPAAA
jgi:hypothetical protein